MNRRTLIKSAAASAGVLMMPKTGILRPRSANAATTANRGVYASHFDGQTRLQENGFPAGTFPDTSPYGMFVYCYRGTTGTLPNTTGPMATFLLETASLYGSLMLNHDNAGGKRPPNPTLRLQISTGASPGAAGGWTASSPLAGLPYDNIYHVLMVEWNLTVPRVRMILDRAPLAVGLIPTAPAGTNIHYNSWGGVPLLWNIGGGISFNGFYRGDLAEVFAYIGTPIDSTDPKIQDGFMQANGQITPFQNLTLDGSHAIPGLIPQIYCSGPGGIFAYSGRGLSNTGTQTLRNIRDPNGFYVAAGQLQTPTTGPFGEVGV